MSNDDLKKQEGILKELNKKIKIVLDKRDFVNKEYDELKNAKIKIRKTRAVLIVGINIIVFLVVSTLLNIFSGLLNVPKLLLYLYYILGGFSAILVQAYGFSCYFNTISDEERLCKDLVKSEKYQNLLEQIKDKEREMKYLDMEYLCLANERDGLEVQIDSLMMQNVASTDKLELKDVKQGDKIIGDGFLYHVEEQDYDISGEMKNDGPVRRRIMLDEVKK